MARREPKPWTEDEIRAVKSWERDLVAEGRCPWGGLPLVETAGVRRCDICDCPGYPPKETP